MRFYVAVRARRISKKQEKHKGFIAFSENRLFVFERRFGCSAAPKIRMVPASTSVRVRVQLSFLLYTLRSLLLLQKFWSELRLTAQKLVSEVRFSAQEMRFTAEEIL